ncbi:hypothetical protein [Nocardia blacklockiae]|uniref:hypothetical protein n=1 Tax=Nocardia blacklockiae TaxID=480036 RepID=UPI002B4B7CA7|nr:hypothetical protein [Nocardia blacklockiae]
MDSNVRWGELEDARIRRLARQLGYALYWPDPSVIPLVDQVRAADVDAVIAPTPCHFDVVQLHALMCVVDVETATPRMSFGRWTSFSMKVDRT